MTTLPDRSEDAQLLEEVLRGASEGFTVYDADFRFSYIGEVDAERFRALGLDPEVLLGKVLWVELPELVGTPVEQRLRQAMEQRVPTTFEWQLGDRWFDVRAYPIGEGRLAVLSPEITERKRTEAERDEQQRLSQALVEINHDILAAQHPDALVEEAIGKALGFLQTDSVALTVRRPAGWEVSYYAGTDPSRVGVLLSDEEMPHAMLAARTRHAVIISNALIDPRVNREVMERYRIGALMVAPLVAHGEVFGVLFATQYDRPRNFTRPQVNFIEKLAASISLALENARLYEAQKNIADTLQKALLRVPADIPDLSVDFLYHSATESAMVGGDFYDVFALTEHDVVLVIGDVSGHGVEAASMAALVRDTLRAYALQGLPLQHVMTLANESLVRQTDLLPFTTVFAVFLRTDTGRLEYASAGHPPALIRRRSGGVEQLGGYAPPLGVFPGVGYEVRNSTLLPGEVLLLYTDGLLEARRDGELFGEARVAELAVPLGGGRAGLELRNCWTASRRTARAPSATTWRCWPSAGCESDPPQAD